MNEAHRTGAGVVLLLALSITTAGCVGFLLGNESLSFAANDATVDGDALQETGYTEYRDESVGQTRNVSVAGQERTVEITNEVRAYNRTGGLGTGGEVELGQLVVFSTPAVEIAGRTLNPLGSLSNRDIARQFGGADTAGSLEAEGNRSVRILGERRTVSEFGTVTRSGDARINSSVHVTTFRHGPDFIVAVAAHPDRAEGERERVDTLLRSLRHSTEK